MPDYSCILIDKFHAVFRCFYYCWRCFCKDFRVIYLIQRKWLWIDNFFPKRRHVDLNTWCQFHNLANINNLSIKFTHHSNKLIHRYLPHFLEFIKIGSTVDFSIQYFLWLFIIKHKYVILLLAWTNHPLDGCIAITW